MTVIRRKPKRHLMVFSGRAHPTLADAVADCAARRDILSEKENAPAPLPEITGADGGLPGVNGVPRAIGVSGVPGMDAEAALLIYLKTLAKGLSSL